MPEPVPFDMATIVAAFTALRHDVNLQTKAVRTATEQTAKVLEAKTTAEPESALKPAIKALVDIADALAISHRQMVKMLEAEPVAEGDAGPAVQLPRQGFLARLLAPVDLTPLQEKFKTVLAQQREATVAKHAAVFQSALDGYAMSLRRVERALADLNVLPVECLGRDFDAETMEVLEIGGDGPPNTVTDVLRRGYTWKGQVFRFAQVRVAGTVNGKT